MRFFRMHAPVYASVDRELAVNGTLEYIYRFPAVSCNICNATYGGSRILNCEAPIEIQNDPRFRSRWPITDQDHSALQQEVAGYLNKNNFAVFETFKPGDNFQPAYFDSKTVPASDFLWPNVRSFVVSDRIKQLVFDELPHAVDIVPITPRRVGPRNGNGASSDAENIEPYYQILVRAQSNYPKGGSPISVCPYCKHEAFDDEKRELSMHADMWQGQPIFLLKTTLYVIVTERFAETIDKIGATNVAFSPI